MDALLQQPPSTNSSESKDVPLLQVSTVSVPPEPIAVEIGAPASAPATWSPSDSANSACDRAGPENEKPVQARLGNSDAAGGREPFTEPEEPLIDTVPGGKAAHAPTENEAVGDSERDAVDVAGAELDIEGDAEVVPEREEPSAVGASEPASAVGTGLAVALPGEPPVSVLAGVADVETGASGAMQHDQCCEAQPMSASCHV